MPTAATENDDSSCWSKVPGRKYVVLILKLIFLYLIQGFVQSVASAIMPIMAHEVELCEDQRALENLMENVWWPYSLKLLWAPIVDFFPICGGIKYHRRGFMIGSLFAIALISISTAVNWLSIDSGDACPNGGLLFAHLLPVLFATLLVCTLVRP